MSQQPDKFFREKLEGFQQPAPASAWDKIAAAQNKKKRRGLWLQIAASVPPLILAGYILWPSTEISKTSPLAVDQQKQAPVAPLHVDQKPDPAAESITKREPAVKFAERNTENSTVQKSEKQTKVSRSVKPVQRNGVAKQNLENSDPLVASVETTAPVVKAKSVSDPVENQTKIAVVETRKTVTLKYTANDVSQYLDNNSEGEATADARKTSTLHKLLKKANDLGTQDPFGELRQKKNEILALNFRSDKQRGQNK